MSKTALFDLNKNYDKFEGYVGAAAVQNGVAVLESLRTTIVQQ